MTGRRVAGRERAHRRLRSLLTVGAFVVAAVGIAAHPVEPTEAAWTRPMRHEARLQSVSLAAIPLACTNTGGLLSGSIGFTWPAPTATPTQYRFIWTKFGGSPVITTVLPGTATTVAVPGNELSLLTTYYATLVADYGTWSTTVSPTRTVVSVLGLPGLNTYTCA